MALQVLLTEADRLGFSLLGRPVGAGEDAAGSTAAGSNSPEAAAQQQEQQQEQHRWRQFRIGSSRELRNTEAFLELLEQMKEETRAAAAAQ